MRKTTAIMKQIWGIGKKRFGKDWRGGRRRERRRERGRERENGKN